MSRILFTFGLLFLFTAPALALRAAPEVMVACTKEAKVCPDGSSVGRTGPGCQFAPCPGETNPDDVSDRAAKPAVRPPQVMCTMEAKICPDGSGVGRTGPNCEFAPCPGESGYVSPEPAPEGEGQEGQEGEGQNEGSEDGADGVPGSTPGNPPQDVDE